MKFFLLYSGDLRPTQSRSSQTKPLNRAESRRLVRKQIAPQMKSLWESNPNLIRLQWNARVPDGTATFLSGPDSPKYVHYNSPPSYPPQDGYIDLSAPIEKNGASYRPLIRESLGLTCSLKFLFLRPGEPGKLRDKSGDIDNRIKTFIDALEMPRQKSEDDDKNGEIDFPLLEDDKLVRGLEISTGRLLVQTEEKSENVHIVLEVTVNIEQPGAWNLCLAGT